MSNKEKIYSAEQLPEFLKDENFLWYVALTGWLVMPTENGPTVVAKDTASAIEALKTKSLVGDEWALKDPRVRVFVIDEQSKTVKEKIIIGNEALGDKTS